MVWCYSCKIFAARLGPHPHTILDSSPWSNLRIYVPPLAKNKGHLGLSFSSSGLFFFFLDKCSPAHPDRSHVASLQFWFIASDPATCNKKAAPGTPIPRQCSDTGDYFKGAEQCWTPCPGTLSAGIVALACVLVKEPQQKQHAVNTQIILTHG